MKRVSLLFCGLILSISFLFAQEENVATISLMDELPKPGLIDQENEISEFDAVEWILSNKVRVILKPTTLQEDEILMYGFSWGGLSVLNPSEAIMIKSMNDLIKISGVAHLSNAELDTLLKERSVSITPYLDQVSENIAGQCAVNDFETMLQLVYLYFAKIALDKNAFTQYLADQKMFMEQRPLSETIFADSVCSVLYRSNPLKTPLKAADLKKINYDKTMATVKDRFCDMDNFTFIFVGDFQLEDVKPLIERYLGSIPATQRKEHWKPNDNIIISTKRITRDYKCKMTNPEVSALLMYAGKMPYSAGGEISMEIFTNLLSSIYSDKLREKYPNQQIHIEGVLKKYPHELFMLQIDFTTTPEAKDEILAIAKNTLADLADSGPNQKDLDRIKAKMLEQYKKTTKTNQYQLEIIRSQLKYGANKSDDIYEKTINIMTPAYIQTLTQQLTQQGLSEIIQNPK
jgi:zinc protease